VRLVVSGPGEETILDEDHLGTIITTLPGFIFGIDPFWGKGDSPLRMTYVRGDNKNVLSLVFAAALKRFEKLEETDGVESWKAEYIEMKYSGPTVMDGERLEGSTKSIEIRPTRPVVFVA